MNSESPGRKGQENSPGGVYFTPTKGGAPGSASGKSDGSGNKRSSGKMKGRYRGGRNKKVTSAGSNASVASSDAGSSWSSSYMESPHPSDAAKHDLHFSDKKKRNNRRRRNKQPKLRNKVESPRTPFNNNNNSHDHHSEKPYLNSATRNYSFGWNTTVCPASMGRATSKKKHDAPMMKRDLYFSLCCERVAIGGKTGGTAEEAAPEPEASSAAASAKSDAVARVTMINWENETILDTFVAVPVPVTDFYDTGITPEDVATDSTKIQSFAEVRKTVETTLKGKILIGYDAEYHLMSLGLTHPSTDTRDCNKFFPEYAVKEEGASATDEASSLETLCKKRLQRSLPPTGHSERPIQNCLAALNLYKKYRKEWEQFLIADARQKQDQENQRATNAMKQQQQPFPQQQHGYASPQTNPVPPRARLGSSDTVNSAISARSVNSMVDSIVSLHCETVQTSSNTLAVARVTVMNGFHEVMLDVFVEVYMPIVTSGDSSFGPEDLVAVNGAVPLAHVRSTVEQMLHGKLVVGYKLDGALQALGLVLPPAQLRDAAYFRPFMYAEMDGVSGTPVVVERSLDELSLEMLQKPLLLPVNRSRPLAACSAVLALYQMYQDRWEQEAYMMQQQGLGPHSMSYAGGSRLIPQHRSGSSWFSWGKKSQHDMQSQRPFRPQNQFQPSVAPTGSMAPTTALSEQAFQALHGNALPPSPTSGVPGGSSFYDGSSQVEPSTLFDGSSHYDRSAHATFDDSSRGIVETFTAPSVASSQHDEASFGVDYDAGGDPELTPNQKSSSWFRFGSKKSRYSSPTSRVSMMAVQEKFEEPTAPLLEPAALDPSVLPDNMYSLNAVDEQSDFPQSSDPKSRSWFGFRRRSLSPSRMAANQAGQGRPSSPSPESPHSGPTVATSGSDDMYDPCVVTPNTAMDAIEVGLPNGFVAEQASFPLTDVSETAALSMSERSGASHSWFLFRKSKSTKTSSEAPSDEPREDPFQLERASDRASDQGDSLAATGKTDGADENWMQEVMSQSTGTGDNDLNSVGFASILDSETGDGESKVLEKPRKSRGSSWFGFKRSKSSKPSRLAPVSDAAEDGASSNGGHKLPGLVSIDNNQKDSMINNGNAWTAVAASTTDSSPSHLGVAWYLGANESGPGSKRSRLPTEATVPTVSTEEEGTDSSGKDFTEEFEKGVAQSFAYLEI
ncbi:MAG: hypothetical protein SGILL_002328 [Bacillariaceae sp.]